MLSARCNNHRFLNTSCTKFVPSFANQPNLNGPAHSLNRCNHRDRVIPRTKGSNHYFIASLMATAAISPGTAWRRAAPYAAASAQLPALIPFPPPAAVRPPAALTFALEASVAAPLHPMPPPRQPLPAPAISPCWHPVGAAPAPLPVLFPLLPLRRLRPRLLTPHSQRCRLLPGASIAGDVANGTGSGTGARPQCLIGSPGCVRRRGSFAGSGTGARPPLLTGRG